MSDIPGHRHQTLLYENLYDYLQIRGQKIRGESSDIDWDKLRLVIVVGGELLNRGYRRRLGCNLHASNKGKRTRTHFSKI